MEFDPDVEMNRDGAVDCGTIYRIDRGLHTHSAVLQLTFAQQTAFRAVYGNGTIIAMHGIWGRVWRIITRWFICPGFR